MYTSDYMTPSPGVSPLTPSSDYSPQTPGSPMDHSRSNVFVCVMTFYLSHLSVSDDMLPSDIEVVIRDGYHVSIM